ncbi:MAG TPA: serine hydrolase domain-containing protein [Blastocatellia bacterium]|nr:serine hydrolase domain-containing protein [Blastocatellia bacterium]
MKRKLTLSIIAFATAIICARAGIAQRAEPRLPETEAGRRVAAFITAFNAGEQLMRRFFAANVSPESLARRPIEPRIENYRNMKSGMGSIHLRRVIEASAAAITVLVEAQNGDWYEIGFQFEPQPPHHFAGFSVEDADPLDESAPAIGPALTEAEFVREVEKLMDGLVKADKFSGVVLIARDEKPVLKKAWGLASKEYNVANSVDTRFNLGSINKVFTKVAVAKLIEQGKLSLDDKLGKHLPDYPNQDAAEKVTVRHLVNMSSGITDFFNEKYLRTPHDRLREIKDFLPLFASDPLRFEPGAKREYSNGGYIVLGAIIEKLSGASYYDYVREHIFKPAGMQNTDSYEADAIVENLASGYTRRTNGSNASVPLRNNIYQRPARGNSAGGGYSTVDDLLKFALALKHNKLLTSAYTGWVVGKAEPSRAAAVAGAGPLTGVGFGAAGGSPGVNALFDIEFGSGYTMIVLSNYDPPVAERTGRQIRAIMKRVTR